MVNLRGLGQQLRSACYQRGGDAAGKVRRASLGKASKMWKVEGPN